MKRTLVSNLVVRLLSWPARRLRRETWRRFERTWAERLARYVALCVGGDGDVELYVAEHAEGSEPPLAAKHLVWVEAHVRVDDGLGLCAHFRYDCSPTTVLDGIEALRARARDARAGARAGRRAT